MKEEWRPVVGYEGLYEVSNLGRVKSLYKACILKPQKKRNGYFQVNLYKNGTMKSRAVHRLVATAFIPNPLGKPQVNHRDEDKQNNAVDNLEWVYARTNLNYGSRNGKAGKTISQKPHRHILQYSLTGELVAEYESSAAAMRKTGVWNTHIIQCCKGKVLTAGGYRWKYKE